MAAPTAGPCASEILEIPTGQRATFEQQLPFAVSTEAAELEVWIAAREKRALPTTANERGYFNRC